MKTRLFLLIILAFSLGACNNVPDEPLVGTWAESGKSLIKVKVLDFHEDGIVHYYQKPGHTSGGVPENAGEGATMRYKVTGDRLYFLGKEIYIKLGKWDTIPYAFSSDFRIQGKTLTIDAFVYYFWYGEGIQTNIYKLNLYKQSGEE